MPNLDGLRGLAAFSVMLYHVEGAKYLLQLPNVFDSPMWSSLQILGVGVFITLSGFLMTYRILSRRKPPSLNSYWKHRASRILPLYFLITTLGLFCFPQFIEFKPFEGRLESNFVHVLVLSILCLPHVVLALYGNILFINVLWTIGIIEHFQIVWSIVLLKLRKHWVKFSLAFILLTLVLRLAAPENHALNTILDCYRFEYFGFGSIAAVFLLNPNKERFDWLFHRITLISIGILYFLPSIVRISYGSGTYFIQGVCVSIFILNLVENRPLALNLDRAPLRYLGKISYEFYVYHSIPLVTILQFQPVHHQNYRFLDQLILYVGTFVLTLLISNLSHRVLTAAKAK